MPVTPERERLRVAFVDDEPEILAALRRRLRGYRGRWEMHFFESPQALLEHAREHGLDVLVSDLAMAEMAGDVLLERVRREFPQIVRILMTARSGDQAVLLAAQVAHRTIFKPFEGPEIEAMIQHGQALRAIGVPEDMGAIIGAISKGPMFPLDVRELTDPLLSVVQSTDLSPARLLAARVYEQLRVPTAVDPNPHWARGLAASDYANQICRSGEFSALIRAHAVVACLLHPLESLLLARYGDKSSSDADRPLLESGPWQGRVFPLAAYTLGLWGFPDEVVEAVAYHQVPRQAPGQSLSALSITHLACTLAYESEPPAPTRAGAAAAEAKLPPHADCEAKLPPPADSEAKLPPHADCEYLTGLGVLDVARGWCAAAREAS